MLSVSTSWNYALRATGDAIVDEIRAAGFTAIELNFALTRPVVDEIIAARRLGMITITSLHNMCPLPPEIDPAKASPDHYSLAATDTAERRAAVDAARATIDCAAACGARAVVLHAGRVPIADRTRELASALPDASRAAMIRAAMVRERAMQSAPCLEAVITSLDELAPYAADRGIAIGIENRYYYREMPLIEELAAILDRFRRANVYYWHDVGHAEAFERLGLVRHRELLDRFANRLLGVHLHDIIGPMGDHRVPGSGTFDFSMLAPYIAPDTITVLEVHQPATASQLRAGADHIAMRCGITP